MTGFAGVLALDGRALERGQTPALVAMGAAIAHRGLAARAVHFAGPIAVVCAADAAVAPDAPFALIDGRARPDALLASYHAQGLAAVAHLPGRFALALWDPARGALHLARDAFGVRPLFYARVRSEGAELLLFGSELKALLAHPACPRALDWTDALVREAMPRRTFPPTTFFPGTSGVPMGSVVRADTAGRLEVSSHATPARPSARELAGDARTDLEVIAQFREVFVQAVDDALGDDAEHTALQLSGGIDSVSIAAVAARRVRLPTFTVLSQSTFGNGDAGLAHRAAAALGLASRQVVFAWDAPMSPDDWRRIVWQCESPHCGPQHYYKLQLHRRAACDRPELRLMLNGEGSDELMGADFRNHGEERDDATFEDYLADLADKQRVDLHGLETLAIESWLGRPAQSREALARASGRPLPAHPWQRRLDYVIPGLEQDVLWRDDRLAAAHGMAADTPYLDPRVQRFIAHIPPRLYGPLFWQKRMLRDALAGIVPEALRHAPKTPFFAGSHGHYTTRMLYAMLMADDRALVRESLGDDGAHPELAPGLVDALLADLAADPRRGATSVLLTLVNLGLLERMARDASARPGPVAEVHALPALERWDEREINARVSPAVAAVEPGTVLAFAPGVELVLRERASAGQPVWYVVVQDAVRYVLDEADTRAWCNVLRHVDGVAPLGAILERVGASLDDVRRYAEEALSVEVLVTV